MKKIPLSTIAVGTAGLSAVAAMYFGIVRPTEQELVGKVDYQEMITLNQHAQKIATSSEIFCSNEDTIDNSNLIVNRERFTPEKVIERMGSPLVSYQSGYEIEEFNDLLDDLEAHNIQVVIASNKGFGIGAYLFNDQSNNQKTLTIVEPMMSHEYKELFEFIEQLRAVDFDTGNEVTTYLLRPLIAGNREMEIVSGNLGGETSIPLQEEEYLYGTTLTDTGYEPYTITSLTAEMPTAPCPADNHNLDN